MTITLLSLKWKFQTYRVRLLGKEKDKNCGMLEVVRNSLKRHKQWLMRKYIMKHLGRIMTMKN
jgi:hypothetical protein